MQASLSTIFIVSSDPEVRRELGRVAAVGVFQVVLFASAVEHLACVKPDRPVAHVIDVHLSDMDGLALQTMIPRTEGVVVVAQRADVGSLVQAFKSGAIDFLTMPADDSSLLGAMQSAVAHSESKRLEQQWLGSLQQRWSDLTAREREVLQLTVSGCLNKQVAAELGISEITVKAHRGRVMSKMHADSFADLVRMATDLNLPLIGARHGARNETPQKRGCSSPSIALQPA